MEQKCVALMEHGKTVSNAFRVVVSIPAARLEINDETGEVAIK